MKYPAGTRVRVAWRPALEGEGWMGRQSLWTQVPLDEGIECVITHRSDVHMLMVESVEPLFFHTGVRTCAFCPGDWDEEGTKWEVIDGTPESPPAPDLCKIIHDYHGSVDVRWTDVEVGALIKELQLIADAYHADDGLYDTVVAVEAMIERAGL